MKLLVEGNFTFVLFSVQLFFIKMDTILEETGQCTVQLEQQEQQQPQYYNSYRDASFSCAFAVITIVGLIVFIVMPLMLHFSLFNQFGYVYDYLAPIKDDVRRIVKFLPTAASRN